MEAESQPPKDWNCLVPAPSQSTGFAEAMKTMGYQPIYFRQQGETALAFVRGSFPLIGRLSARANILTANTDPDFLSSVLSTLKKKGVAYAKVGDTMWGLSAWSSPDNWPFRQTEVVLRHTFTLDLNLDEETLFRKLDQSVRTSVRKAKREGVEIREVQSESDLGKYCKLSSETSARVRGSTAYTDFPAAFFKKLHEGLIGNSMIRCYLAWRGEMPLAGAIFLCSRDRTLYFSAASTRDRECTTLQAPTAVLWHAVQEAKRSGMTVFDFGGCTPVDDPNDSRYGVYIFKKRWGGQLARFYNLHVVLSGSRFLFQERVLSPLWDRFHPVYFKLLGLR